MPEKNMFDTMVTWARPPRICPTSERAKATMRSVMPQAFISSPAMMKNGMASSVNESTPTKARVTMPFSGNVLSKIRATADAMPNANAIGMLISSRMKNVANRIVSIDMVSPPAGRPQGTRR